MSGVGALPLAAGALAGAALGSALTVVGTIITGYYQRRTKKDELESQQRETERTVRREALERRLENYRAFLELEQHLRAMLASADTLSTKEYEDWFARFNGAYTLLLLTGSDQARHAAEKLQDHIAAMDQERLKKRLDEPPGSDPDEQLAAHLREAFSKREDELDDLHWQLITSMREDVSPGDPGQDH